MRPEGTTRFAIPQPMRTLGATPASTTLAATTLASTTLAATTPASTTLAATNPAKTTLAATNPASTAPVMTTRPAPTAGVKNPLLQSSVFSDLQYSDGIWQETAAAQQARDAIDNGQGNEFSEKDDVVVDWNSINKRYADGYEIHYILREPLHTRGYTQGWLSNEDYTIQIKNRKWTAGEQYSYALLRNNNKYDTHPEGPQGTTTIESGTVTVDDDRTIAIQVTRESKGWFGEAHNANISKLWLRPIEGTARG